MTGLYELFYSLDAHTYKLREIRQHSGALWFKFAVQNDFRDIDSQTIAPFLIPKLVEFAEHLSQFDGPALRQDEDKFEDKAAAFLGLGGGLTLNSLIHYFQYSGNKVPLIIDMSLLIETSFLYGLITTILLMCLAFLLLGRRARTHLVLFEFLIIGSVAFISTIYVGTYKFNIEYDNSDEIHVQTQIIEKEVLSRNFRSSNHNIKLENWNDKSEPIKIKVSKQLFDGSKRRDSINIILRKGYFGYEWIESINKLD